VAFTSGSTGEPKGLVHCHGAMASICDTLCYSFGVPHPAGVRATKIDYRVDDGTPAGGAADQGDSNRATPQVAKRQRRAAAAAVDVALVVATPAWITGQSYMLSACLSAGISSVLLEGSPVAPRPTRFAHVSGALPSCTHPFWLRFAYATPVLVHQLRIWRRCPRQVIAAHGVTVFKAGAPHRSPRPRDSPWRHASCAPPRACD
jgi:acyl-CoA synthetase (AMP-forming)/AMP-acid ligase II